MDSILVQRYFRQDLQDLTEFFLFYFRDSVCPPSRGGQMETENTQSAFSGISKLVFITYFTLIEVDYLFFSWL